MNPNVEIIAPELWAVNKNYIGAGYIKEFRHIPNTNLGQIMLSNTGIIVLDKGSKHYPILKKMFPAAMRMNRAELEAIVARYGNQPNLPVELDEWLNVAGWELKRRVVRAEYLNSLPYPMWLYEIIEHFRKKVRLWQRSEQR
ncbi:hypothetical protein [Gemmiger formicilis]